MQHPFAALAGEYAMLLARATLLRPAETRQVAARLIESKWRWIEVNAADGVPIAWSLASFEREASNNYRLSPAQGDPWDRKSVNVPRDRGPFRDFKSAALDAYRLDGLDAVGAANWTWTYGCYAGESFNGFGPRNHGIHTGYLWAGTNIYTCGKYTSDGHWDAGVRDQQLGIVPLMAAMIELDPALAFAGALPVATDGKPVPAPQAVPLGVGGGEALRNAAWIQQSLNMLMRAGLAVDGSYGRQTRRAVIAYQQSQGLDPDGLAGPKTLAAIDASLAAAR